MLSPYGEDMGGVISGITLAIDDEAVVVTAAEPLTVVSSATVGGGFTQARSIMNLHVKRDFPHERLDAQLAGFARGRGLPEPWVGLFTGAWTARARVGEEMAGGISVMAVATVGLSNLIAAGVSAPAGGIISTINTVVIVDAVVEPAALVNAIITVTEVKTAALTASGRRCADGTPATGTSTDAVVIAATGRGPHCRFAGPVSELGWVIARAARTALNTGVKQWPGTAP